MLVQNHVCYGYYKSTIIGLWLNGRLAGNYIPFFPLKAASVCVCECVARVLILYFVSASLFLG